MNHIERYERSTECVEVRKGVWERWRLGISNAAAARQQTRRLQIMLQPTWEFCGG